MEGFFSMIISGKVLDFIEIKQNIGLEPSKIIKQGQEIGENRESTEDRCIYIEAFCEENFEEKLENFLEAIYPYKNYINHLSESVLIELNVYLTSELAQIGFSLSKKALNEIVQLNLLFNFHIMSYGLVENN